MRLEKGSFEQLVKKKLIQTTIKIYNIKKGEINSSYSLKKTVKHGGDTTATQIRMDCDFNNCIICAWRTVSR